MGPDHDGLAPACPSQSQSLAPDLLFFPGDAVEFTLLLLFPPLDVLVLSRRPLLLPALLEELGARLLESRYREEREFVVLGDLDGRPRDHHGSKGLVAPEKVLARVRRHHNQMGLQVLGILDQQTRINDGRQ